MDLSSSTADKFGNTCIDMRQDSSQCGASEATDSFDPAVHCCACGGGVSLYAFGASVAALVGLIAAIALTGAVVLGCNRFEVPPLFVREAYGPIA